jgi:hypothetical protein
VCLTAVITALMFRSRGKQAEALISGTGEFIAEWSIPAELWREILQRQYEEEKSAKMMLLRIVWFFCLTIGGGFIIYDPEAGVWVAAVLLFVMVATGLAMLGDELHSWSMVGSWLQGVDLETEEGRYWLRVRYAFLTRTGVQEEQVLLPVPPAEMPKAELAVTELTKLKRDKQPSIQR